MMHESVLGAYGRVLHHWEEEGRARGLIDTIFRPLIDWIPGYLVNLLIGAAAGVAALAYVVFAAVHGRGRTRRFEAPGPSPVAAIHYAYGDLSMGRKLLPAFVALAFWLLGMWDMRRGVFDLGKLAFIGLPTLVLLLLAERRRLRSRPAVALHAHGISLDSLAGETLVPWKEVAYVETDPAVSTGSSAQYAPAPDDRAQGRPRVALFRTRLRRRRDDRVRHDRRAGAAIYPLRAEAGLAVPAKGDSYHNCPLLMNLVGQSRR